MPGLATEPGRARARREFGRKQQNPVRRFGGIAAVLLLHVVLIYALVNGLATKVVQVIQHPIETKIIEQVKPPPPPPLPTVQLPPPKFAPPPPPFVPPPEVNVPTPPQPSITHQAAPVVAQPAPPPAPVAPAPAKAASTEVGVVCPNSDQVRRSIRYPREAQQNNITGNVLIEFVVDPQGRVADVRVAQSADPLLDRAALNAVKQFSCVSQGEAVRVQVPFAFNLN
ncbi:putative iron-transport protein [Burkholderia lata]|uniref:Protein TonB n=1 Tax=Burkholderia lata (strain ATCC 17760 / DSM 23089 / LMG 22485 / NCIMB 9086 / R18194 / 383) TaxID=482957 RepID=A0A6P2SRF9_BURL3|nr:energy transducer TonB [Burkholderia lata]VWC52281.1 putative iron-transport protein [Burkholderia lata]